MRLRTCWMSLIFGLIFFSSTAQTPEQIRELADIYFKHGKYQDAVNEYLKYQKEQPKDYSIKYKAGACFFELGDLKQAEQYLSFAATRKESDKMTWFYLGRLYQDKMQFREAIRYYKRYISETSKGKGERATAKHYIKQCAAGLKLKYLTPPAIVDNVGATINDKGDELSPVLHPKHSNRFFFSSARKGNQGGLMDLMGGRDEILGKYKTDIFSTGQRNGIWEVPEPIERLVNSSRNEVMHGISDNGQVMFYYKGKRYGDGFIYTDSLMSPIKTGFPKEFKSPIRIKEGDASPFFFNDSIIVYASKKQGGQGGLDLYITQRIQQKYWTQPQNLGDEINGPNDEISPFLSKDGRTLYFSSNRANSLGGFDIFMSKFDDNTGKWSTPENMGAPINSTRDDVDFVLSPDGLKAYFCSDRVGGIGGFDIYSAYFKSVQRAMLASSDPVIFTMVGKPSGTSPSGTLVNTGNHSSSGGAMTGGNSSEEDKGPGVYDQTDYTGIPDSEIQKIEIEDLMYQGENILTEENIRHLQQVLEVANRYPKAIIELSGHADDTDPEKFRVYFSFMKTLQVYDYLVQQGVNPNNMIIRGCGSSFPAAKNVNSDGSPSRFGKKWNKAIAIRILNIHDKRLKIVKSESSIPESVKLNSRKEYESSQSGLIYKVQVAALPGMFESDLLVKHKGALVERKGKQQQLRYLIGMSYSFSSAKSLANQLKRDGVLEPYIIAYVNGVRIDPLSAEKYKKKYPDLKNYLGGF